MLRTCLASIVLCSAFAASSARADALADITKYSIYQQVDLASLDKGKVISQHGPSLGGDRDLTVQSIYIVHAPVAAALDLHKNWDAARHPELKVYAHHDFPAHPKPGDFALAKNAGMESLGEATSKLPNMGDLQMSKGEAVAYKAGQSASDFWGQLLYRRASAFADRGIARAARLMTRRTMGR